VFAQHAGDAVEDAAGLELDVVACVLVHAKGSRQEKQISTDISTFRHLSGAVGRFFASLEFKKYRQPSDMTPTPDAHAPFQP
jgi:hypothetical protein